MAKQKKSLISNMKASKKAQVASKAETKGAKLTSLSAGLRHANPTPGTRGLNFKGATH